MDEDVVLGKDALKAISSDARIKIMKALLERQKTQSEIAKELELSAPTILEHMDKLLDSKLIEPVPEYQNKKWKYYRLTKTGRTLIEGKRTSIVLMLSYTAAALAVALVVFSLISQSSVPPGQGPSPSGGLAWSSNISYAMKELCSSSRSILAIVAMLAILGGIILFGLSTVLGIRETNSIKRANLLSLAGKILIGIAILGIILYLIVPILISALVGSAPTKCY